MRGRTLTVSFSGRVCKNVHCSRGSRARAAGAQLVSASVAPLAWLQARRRDLSTIGPNGVHRRCSTAGRWTLNGRFGDEYGSSPLYGSVTGTYTPRAVSLGSPRGLSRSYFEVVVGDVLPRACGCRDVSDGALGERGEPRCAGATSSCGSYSMVMLCIHPVQGPGAAGPVAKSLRDD